MEQLISARTGNRSSKVPMNKKKNTIRKNHSSKVVRQLTVILAAAALFCGITLLPSQAARKRTANASGTSVASQASAATQNIKSGENDTASSGKGLTVTFLDVGQGDSALVVCDGEAMLVDGGESSESSAIYSVLKAQGITKLKYIVATHPHADHVGGLAGALGAASCEKVLSPVSSSDNSSFQKLAKKCRQKSVPIEVPKEGDTYTLGSAGITILGPTDELPDDPNNNSLFFRLDYGSVSFLFTGDAEQLEQQLLLHNEYDLLRADVLKMPHHGSSNGASEAFMNAVDPDYAVISCGLGNSYGHPHEETISLLKKHNTTLYRTDLQGDIVCTSDGKGLTFTTEKTTDQNLYVSGSELDASADGDSTPENTDQKSAADSKSAALSSSQASGNQTQHTYIANRNTGKFHDPSCPSVKKMKESNKLTISATREQMIADGYSPCGNCKP